MLLSSMDKLFLGVIVGAAIISGITYLLFRRFDRHQGEQLMAGKRNQEIDEQQQSLPCCVRSEVNQRENNEDSFQIAEIVPVPGQAPITILAVADGMGGHLYGEVVSKESLSKVSATLYQELTVSPSLNRVEPPQPPDSETLSKAMMEALKQGNSYVRRMVETNKWGRAGSTIVVAAVCEDMAVVANLGDSPLFHYQTKRKKLTKVTEDHTVAGVLLRAGLISPEMARYHEGRSRLEFYMGCPNLPEKEPIYQVPIASGDILLLCSDGVNGSLSEEQMANIFAKAGGDLKNLADRLLAAALDAGETDNQTLILWQHPKAKRRKGKKVGLTIIQSQETTRQADEQMTAAIAELRGDAAINAGASVATAQTIKQTNLQEVTDLGNQTEPPPEEDPAKTTTKSSTTKKKATETVKQDSPVDLDPEY